MSPAPYDVAAAFRQARRSAIARGHLSSHIAVRAFRMVDMLVVVIEALPDGAFNPDYLEHGPANRRPFLSPLGEACWSDISKLALEIATEAGVMAGAFLHPNAIDSARERLPRKAA